MSLLNIQDTEKQPPFSLFVLGFRPFFLAGGLYAVLAMAAWVLLFHTPLRLPLQDLPAYQWHAHEMLFGFSLAVVSGFLLTAVRNWTGMQTLQYRGLGALLAAWAAARLLMLGDPALLPLAALCDLAFNVGLLLALSRPVFRVRQWTQLGVLSKILLLGVCNLSFYLGLAGYLPLGVYWGLAGGLYLVIALVMTIGRRVVPFFIEKGIDAPVSISNSRALDIASLVLFVGFAISDVFLLNSLIAGYFAAALVGVSLWRLYNWHAPGIWRRPLLWGLYVAFICIVVGFALFAWLPYSAVVSRSLALHALAVGGVGLITLSMMSRVSLGHTGRSIHEPLPFTGLAQGLVLAGAGMRIIPEMLVPQWHSLWMLLAQVLWIAGFGLFVVLYYPMLTKPRVDGQTG